MTLHGAACNLNVPVVNVTYSRQPLPFTSYQVKQRIIHATHVCTYAHDRRLSLRHPEYPATLHTFAKVSDGVILLLPSSSTSQLRLGDTRRDIGVLDTPC